jgi:hypothetical protein
VDCNHCVTLLIEVLDEQLAQLGVVVDDENPIHEQILPQVLYPLHFFAWAFRFLGDNGSTFKAARSLHR